MDPQRRTPLLVGRASEIAELDAEFGRACSGQFRCVLIEGEPGVGKTRLANEFADRTRDRATRLRARGHPLGVTEPFGLWSELLDGHLRGLEPAAVEALSGGMVEDLAGLFRAAAAIHGAWRDDVRPGRLREALATLLANLSRQRPVVAVLDDIHLADSSSWEALGYLARALGDAPILVLITVRADEIVERPIARHILFGLEQDDVLARRALHRLDRDGVGVLAHRMLGRRSVPPQLTTWLFERSRGNPLFAIEVLEDLLAQDADLTAPSTERAPRQLSERIAARLERLDLAARDTLDLLAVLGRCVMSEELSRLDPRSAEAMPALEASGLVDLRTGRGAERWEISHPLIQSAIYDQMAAPRRRTLHRRVARMLVSVGRLGESAPHFVRVAESGDTEAVRVVTQALAESWRRGTFAEAFTVLGSLVDLIPTGDSRWSDVLDAMPYTAEWSSVYNRIPIDASGGIVALREVNQMLADGEAGRGDHARLALVNLYLADLLGWCTGELEEAGSRAEAAVAHFRAAGQGELARIAGNEHAWIQALACDFAAQEASTRSLLADARFSGDDNAVVMAMGSLAATAYTQGRFEEAEQVLLESIDLAREQASPPRERYGLAVLASVLALGGRLDAGRDLLHKADAVPHSLSDPLLPSVALSLSLLAGDVTATLRDGPHAVSTNGPLVGAWSATFLAMAAAEAQRVPAARRYLAHSAELLSGRRRWIMSGHHDWAAGLVALADDDADQAVARLDAATASLLEIGALPYAGRVAVDLAEAALIAGQPGVAEAAARSAAEVARALDRDHFLALSAVAASYAALARGDHGYAADRAGDASALLAGHGYRGLEARCQALLGHALAPTDRPKAVTKLGAAGEAFDELGSTRRREQVLAELAHLGKSGQRAADVLRGPDSLTDRERQVVALAVEGLTAKQMGRRLYIGERTVETHLAHAYAKFGVRTRLELARAVDTRADPPQR